MIRPPVRLAAVTLFWPLFAVWTWLLVRPNPIPEVVDSIPADWQFLAAKTLHGGTYAALATLGWLWPTTARGRWAVLALLLAHGVGTEIIQTFVPNRSGRVRDVVIDWTGILIGWTLVRYFVWNLLITRPVLPTSEAGEEKFSD